MGGVARSELVAAVAEAGGFGFLGMVREPPELIAQEVARLRDAGHDRFGVNIIPAATERILLERQIGTCIELAVPWVALFWDIDAEIVSRFSNAGVRVAYQVSSSAEAIAAERAGAEVIIAQGCEAGGHVRGTTRLADLLPQVAQAVSVPTLAAGGLATGGDLLTAMALGADGIVLGTALIATPESFAHSVHKERLLGARGADTVLTDIYQINWPPGAKVRVLKSDVTAGLRGDPATAERMVIGQDDGRPIVLFSTDSPLRSTTGELDLMALYSGTGVGRITRVQPAGERIKAIVTAADELMNVARPIEDVAESSSAVCYAGEMGGAYMGMMDEAELADELGTLKGLMRRALIGTVGKGQGDAQEWPPFAESAYPIAACVLGLQTLSVGSDSRNGQTSEPPQAVSLKAIEAEVMDRLGRLLPRVPEGPTRQLLAAMRQSLVVQAFKRAEPAGSVRATIPDANGITEEMIERLVRRFYGRIRDDERLGPIFLSVLGDDWEEHLLRMIDFWSSLMLLSGRYSGSPMPKHIALRGITREDFGRWLTLFEQTALEVGTERSTAAFMVKANRVAQSFQMAMFDELGLGPAVRPKAG